MRARRLLVLCVGALLVVLFAGAGGIALWTWQRLHSPFRKVDGDVVFEIETGEGVARILDRLQARGLLWNARLARLYLVYAGGDPPLKAGEYRFDRALSTPEVLEKLARGEVVTYAVTLVEGLTLEETAAHLAASGFGDRQTFEREMSKTTAMADWDPEATNLEGYLFPDTYSFARGTSEARIVDALVQNFRLRFEREVRPLLGTPTEAGHIRRLVTLAAIVEKEARLAEERPMIAGVFNNRLRIGMALYADPTIIFALKQMGTWDGNLRRKDLQLDSPYNTYRHAGLPPGPICSPRLASLQAAARPADVPYLYFVSRNDGSHVFASTLAEHNRNVQRWQKQYWRERWASKSDG
jgi:UPF0755 protein